MITVFAAGSLFTGKTEKSCGNVCFLRSDAQIRVTYERGYHEGGKNKFQRGVIGLIPPKKARI